MQSSSLHKEGGRQRRDSDRSDGGRGRERRLSSSSGKTSHSSKSPSLLNLLLLLYLNILLYKCMYFFPLESVVFKLF